MWGVSVTAWRFGAQRLVSLRVVCPGGLCLAPIGEPALPHGGGAVTAAPPKAQSPAFGSVKRSGLVRILSISQRYVSCSGRRSLSSHGNLTILPVVMGPV
jgi:hypothetical protein